MKSFSWLFQAKPQYRLRQLLTAIGSVVSWEAMKVRGVNGHAVAGILALVITVAGSVFIGGALWLAQGAHTGGGDAMGVGILVSLGAALILFGLGTALASSVTYLVRLPLQSQVEDAVEPPDVEDAPEPQEAVRPETVRRLWWPFGQRA